ncbi:MAG: 6-bladed beta-propeller [Prevotellaceae bacterium]|jgi:hypothetical protein|nr:6-bladed beta-propeller [Prevotellaceae bacterium]
MKKVLPVILPACFMLAGCRMSSDNSNRQDLSECPQVAGLEQVGSYKVTVCDPGLLKDTVLLPLSYLTEELHMIQLENNADALVSNVPVTVGEKFILVRAGYNDNTPYRLFNKSGKFIANIGAKGKGPNEYGYILEEQLDEKNNRVYLLPYRSDKILVYDLEGNHLEPVRLPVTTSASSFRVNPDNGIVAVVRPPQPGVEAATSYFAWSQTMSGEIIKCLFPNSMDTEKKQGINYTEVYSGGNLKNFDFYIYNLIPRKDTLYHYEIETNRRIPQFTFDFKNGQIPDHYYTFELPHHFLGMFAESKEIFPRSFLAVNKKVYLIEKSTLKGAYIKLKNDFLGDIEVEDPAVNSFKKGYYMVNYDPADLLEKLENALLNKNLYPEMQKKLINLKNSIKETDNNYVFYAKLKQ